MVNQNKQEEITLTNEEAIKEFLLDINCLDRIKPWIYGMNIFDVLKISRTEIRHSNILAWLLDANENHGLSDFVVRGLIQRVIQEHQTYCESRHTNVLKLLTMDYSHFSVFREWKSIDILLLSKEDKVVICIENKVGTGEHDNQLVRYRETVESTYPPNENYEYIYIYLTPEENESSDPENWMAFSYNGILSILREIKMQDADPSVKLLIENYIATIRRYIVKDKELEEICADIYKKHKQALDLIFENKPDSGYVISELIKEYLSNRAANEGDILFKPENSNKSELRFSLQSFDKLFPPVSNVKGGWGNGINYFWEIRDICSEGKLRIKLTFYNFEDQNGYKVAKLSQLFEKELKGDWQWKIIDSFNVFYSDKNKIDEFLEADYDDIKKELFSKLDKAMERVLSFEKKVLALWK